MADLKTEESNRKFLKSEFNIGYILLKEAIENKDDDLNAKEYGKVANIFYKELNKYLLKFTGNHNLSDVERGHPLEEFIIEYYLASVASEQLEFKPKLKKSNKRKEDLIETIDDTKQSLLVIRDTAQEFAKAGKFKILLNAINYVRGKYNRGIPTFTYKI